MIDMHTHILPHIDDGAKDTETSVAMLKSLKNQGVKTVVLTPHYYGKRRSPASFLEKRNAAFAHLKPKLPEDMNIVLGAEVYFTGLNMSAYEELCKLAIGDTQYILIEFPFTSVWGGEILSALANFIRETEYIPIIAHAERYREMQKNPLLVSELIKMGCLIQVNAESFLGGREKKFAYALLKHGFVHCIGTDAHNMAERAPKYREGKATVIRAGYEKEWFYAESVAEKVLLNERIVLNGGKPIKKFLGKYF